MKTVVLFSLTFFVLSVRGYSQNFLLSNAISNGDTSFSEATTMGGVITWGGDTTNFPNSDSRGGGFFYQRHYANTSSGLGSFKIVTTTSSPTTLYVKFLSAPDTWTDWYKIWHAGNDGTGSGLDADLIRGQSPQWITSGNLIYSTNSGNVLIGKTSQINASYKLDVKGNIRADKLVVNTTGADFVFDSTYRLYSLAEVNSYIIQHRHLPGIAAAKKMQSDGMDVGDMQTKLLQKIEELTLYLIQQQQEMANQQNKLEEQQHQLQDQQERIRMLEQLLKTDK